MSGHLILLGHFPTWPAARSNRDPLSPQSLFDEGGLPLILCDYDVLRLPSARIIDGPLQGIPGFRFEPINNLLVGRRHEKAFWRNC